MTWEAEVDVEFESVPSKPVVGSDSETCTKKAAQVRE